MPAPAPAAQLAATNSMAQAVDLAHQQSESTPQLSFGQVWAHTFMPCWGAVCGFGGIRLRRDNTGE